MVGSTGYGDYDIAMAPDGDAIYAISPASVPFGEDGTNFCRAIR